MPTVRWVGSGDIGTCGKQYDSITAVQVVNYLAQWPDATVYTVGDNVGDYGTAAEYADCYAPTWGRFRDKTRPTIGNHEYSKGNATPTFDYFGALVGPRGLGYYSYDLGAWHIIALNSNTSYVSASLGSAQETWLKNDLARNTKACILAYWHWPRFYSTEKSQTVSTAMRQIWVDLYAAGATLIVNGHTHRWERFAPQDPDGNATPRGPREFIVGVGGRDERPNATVIAKNSEVRKGNIFGITEFLLGDGWYSWTFMPIPGRSFTESGTGTCVNAPAANRAPVANPGGPYTGTAGAAVAFDGSGSSDPDGDALTYAWTFGDGSSSTAATPTHTYASSGTYSVTLTVTDARGLASAQASTTATIAAKPPEPPGGTVRLIGAGDIANCVSVHDSETSVLVANYLAQHPDATVFTLGDNVGVDGTAAEYTNCYQPRWGRFKAATRPAIGDHEYKLGNATPTYDYFGASAGPRNLGYYSYDAGSWHIVVLNSQVSYVPMSAGSAQETWLRNDLAATTKPCILAYWHNPRFYSSTTTTPTVPSSWMRQAWVDLYAAGATLVLNGDAHRYERFAPQDPEGKPDARGIREFIVGTGGEWAGPQPTTVAPNGEVQKGAMYGVLELQLENGSYAWNYISIPQSPFSDAGTGRCVSRGATVVPPIARPAGPYSGTAGTAITFDGSASNDPDGNVPLTYAWNFGDGGTGSGVRPSHTYLGAGTYTVTLTVTDATGVASAPATTTATIAPKPNRAPVANAGGPYTGTMGSAVAFDGSGSSDPDGDALTYAWTFGDGGNGTGAKPAHTYASSGTYTVTLTVTDARGLASTPVTTTAIIAAKPPAGVVRLIGAGDIGNCSSSHPSETASLVTSYRAQHPDATVFTLGDNVPDEGAAAEYTNCYQPTWGQFKAVTRPAIGDHEYTLGNATPTYDYFGASVGPRDLGYYSYDVGSWHVVVLNSQISYVPMSAGSAQDTWLKTDLAATTKPCILAYWHNPRFYSTEGSAPVASPWMQQAWVDLYAAGATLVLNGDAHRYERFAPQDPDGNPNAHGIREFIVGTGGDWAGPQPTMVARNSEVQKGAMYGVLELQLGDGTYAWNYISIPQRPFTDAGTGSCVARQVGMAPRSSTATSMSAR